MNCKGIGWIYFKKYLTENFSPDEIEKFKAEIDEQSKSLLEKAKILPTSWVDYGTYIKTLFITDRVLGKGNLDFIRQFNYYHARGDAKGIYKVLISVLSPQTVVKTYLKLFRQYYDKGKLTVLSSTSHGVVFKVEDAPDIPLYHDIEQGAYIEELLHMSGAKNIKVTTQKCMAKDDPYCLHMGVKESMRINVF